MTDKLTPEEAIDELCDWADALFSAEPCADNRDEFLNKAKEAKSRLRPSVPIDELWVPLGEAPKDGYDRIAVGKCSGHHDYFIVNYSLEYQCWQSALISGEDYVSFSEAEDNRPNLMVYVGPMPQKGDAP